jgi:hypothetical protein
MRVRQTKAGRALKVDNRETVKAKKVIIGNGREKEVPVPVMYAQRQPGWTRLERRGFKCRRVIARPKRLLI